MILGKLISRKKSCLFRAQGALRRPGPMIEALDRRTLLSATYYVSLKGSDANNGDSPTTAWRHIQHACNVAAPGSTVDVLAGRYNEKVSVNGIGERP